MNDKRSVVEVNFDCLVGPTHNFGGLSYGNLASTKSQNQRSNPKKAALQGLEKMRILTKKGFVQGVFPPHERPLMKGFHNFGFNGPDQIILQAAHQRMPRVFFSFCSSSFMWAANAGTVSPALDTKDQKTHLSPANLITMFHRSIEHEFTQRIFKFIFADAKHFVVHDALLSHDILSDEGAANHNRFSKSHSEKGIEIFVYSKDPTQKQQKTKIFPARQSALASEAIALRHGLDDRYLFIIEQNPLAIDKGAFHNDVVCVVNENVLLCHSLAFLNQREVIAKIRSRFFSIFHEEPHIIEVANEDLPIEDAVLSYLFNSQLLTKENGRMLLFAPADCLSNQKAHAVIRAVLSENNPIDEVEYFNISESMANGGGPACLRLRMLLNPCQLASLKPSVLLSDELYNQLFRIIEKYYVDELVIENFFDKNFLDSTKAALSEISSALGLGNIYDFQIP